MKHQVVMFDVDGVLADFMKGFTALVAQKYGNPVVTDHDYALWDVYPGLNKEMADHGWSRVKESHDFWQNLDSLVSKEVFWQINDMQEDGQVDTYFVTHRQGCGVRKQTARWLWAHGITSPTVILSGNKGEVARGINADFMIDDKAGNVIFTAYHSPKTHVFVVDRPYNQFKSGVVGSRVCRVKTVEEFLTFVDLARR